MDGRFESFVIFLRNDASWLLDEIHLGSEKNGIFMKREYAKRRQKIERMNLVGRFDSVCHQGALTFISQLKFGNLCKASSGVLLYTCSFVNIL